MLIWYRKKILQKYVLRFVFKKNKWNICKKTHWNYIEEVKRTCYTLNVFLNSITLPKYFRMYLF